LTFGPMELTIPSTCSSMRTELAGLCLVAMILLPLTLRRHAI
jgi:hypothetical protein